MRAVGSYVALVAIVAFVAGCSDGERRQEGGARSTGPAGTDPATEGTTDVPDESPSTESAPPATKGPISPARLVKG